MTIRSIATTVAARLLSVFILASICVGGVRAVLAQAEAAGGKTVRLLTVGNSFAENSTRCLRQIVDADGKHELILGKANLGGCSLQRHWQHVDKHEADPDAPEGKPYRGESLKEIVRSRPWDVVTIQQYSWLSHDLATYRPYGRDLCDYIRKHAPQAEVMFHQTWAYRADDKGRLKNNYTQEDMHRDVRNGYHTIAAELGIRIIPVGEAFAAARRHSDWNFVPDIEFDYENPLHPNLPKERHSLCTGYRWTKDNEGELRFALDTHHAGSKGQYLGAAVFYETLFGESILGNSYRPRGVPANDVIFLQRIAHETVATPGNVVPQRK